MVFVVVQTAVRLVTVARTYWWEDDYTHLVSSQDANLSWHLLVHDYKDHLEILTNAIYWALARHPTSSFVGATVIIVALQVAVSVLMWVALRLVFGSRPFLLVPFAVFLFTPLALVDTLWPAAAFQGLPLQACMLAGLCAAVLWARTKRWWWAAASVCASVIGMLFWEKGLVILPFLLAFHLLVLWRGRPWSERARVLRTQWHMWLPHAVAWIAYLVLYLQVVDGSERNLTTNDGVTQAAAVKDVVLETFLPGLYGSPWTPNGAAATLYPISGPLLQVLTVLVLLVVVAISWLVLGQRAWAAWAMLAIYVAGDVGLLFWGRAGFFSITARDPRYVFDALPVVCLCLAAAFLRVGKEPAPTDRTIQVPLRVATPLAVAVGASCLLMTIQLAPTVERTFSRQYLSGVLTWLERYPDRERGEHQDAHRCLGPAP